MDMLLNFIAVFSMAGLACTGLFGGLMGQHGIILVSLFDGPAVADSRPTSRACVFRRLRRLQRQRDDGTSADPARLTTRGDPSVAPHGGKTAHAERGPISSTARRRLTSRTASPMRKARP